MDDACPCYRAIYSAVPRVPSAVVSIITDYNHTFSDSDFESLAYATRDTFAVGVGKGMMAYLVDDVYSESQDRQSYFTMSFVKHSYQLTYVGPRPKTHWTTIYCYHVNESGDYLFSWNDNHFDEHAWECIQKYFSQDGNYIERRRSMLDLRPAASDTKRSEPTPEVFDTWCNTIFRYIGDLMYSRSHTLTCPRLPDPMHKK